MGHQVVDFIFPLTFSKLVYPPHFNSRYGDKVPLAKVSKVFAILWILMGLVVMGILSGVLTSAITVFVFEADISLYGAKVRLQ